MRWFKRKQQQPAPASTDRYAAKPLLILMDSYVLNIIGELRYEKGAELFAVARQAYGGGPDWLTIMRTRFQLSRAMEDLVRQMWVTEQGRAEQEGTTLTPEDFARRVVDENFAHLLD